MSLKRLIAATVVLVAICAAFSLGYTVGIHDGIEVNKQARDTNYTGKFILSERSTVFRSSR